MVMYKLKYILILSMFLAVISLQAQVTVNLRPPPQYGFKLEKMWNVTLVNNSQVTYTIYLRGVAAEQTEGFIVDAVTGTFTLPPGVKVVSASDIKPIKVNETNKKYENVVKNVGTVPTGNYEICVYVINSANSQEMGSDCISTEVINLTQVELLSPENAVMILHGGKKKLIDQDYPDRPMKKKLIDQGVPDSPMKKKDIDEDIPMKKKLIDQSPPTNNISISYMAFTWLPPTPITGGQRVTYKLKIAQSYGRQTSYDAMQSNPLYYQADNLITTIYQYPVAARQLSSGKYAWQVEAYINGVLMSKSEVWEFQIGEDISISRSDKNLKYMNRYWALNDGYQNSTGSESQTQKKPFMFAFDSKLFGESANRSGTGSDKEPRYGYWELNPSLSLYGLPFSMPLLFSTENSASRQNINTLGLNLDISTIKDFITERIEKEKDKILQEAKKEITSMTDKQKDKLESDAKGKVMSGINPLLKVVTSFRTLGFGTTYPDYTPLTVSGVPLTGVNVELNPGWLYLAFGGFKNQKPIDNESYKRNIYTGRLGVGQKDATHLYFTGMLAKDDENSITLDPSNQVLTPKANYLFGIEGKLELFRKKLSLEGEISGAMLTRDTRDADLESNAIPQFVKNMIHPKISSSVDYSYTLKGVFNNEKSNTKVTTGLRMLGPGYTSLGVPNLSTDKLEFKTKIDQKFHNKQIGLTGEFMWQKDNLIEWKRYTTNVTRFSIGANFRFKGMPYFNLMFAPTFMTNNAASQRDKLDNKFYVLSVFTGHNYSKWDVNFNSSLSYFMNSSSNLDSIITESVNVHNVVFSQMFSFKFPLTLSGSFGMSFANYPGDYSRILSTDISATYLLMDVLNYMVGFSTAYEKDKNKKNMFYIGTSIGYKQYINFEVRAEKNLYHDWFDNRSNYDEFLIRGTVTTNW